MFSIKIKGHNRSESQFKGLKKTLRSETVREVKVEPHTHTHTHRHRWNYLFLRCCCHEGQPAKGLCLSAVHSRVIKHGKLD